MTCKDYNFLFEIHIVHSKPKVSNSFAKFKSLKFNLIFETEKQWLGTKLDWLKLFSELKCT